MGSRFEDATTHKQSNLPNYRAPHTPCFYDCALVLDVTPGHHFLSTLVERLRNEILTFHFHVGEYTITFEDVALKFDLRIDSGDVTGKVYSYWKVAIHYLLGQAPTDFDIIRN